MTPSSLTPPRPRPTSPVRERKHRRSSSGITVDRVAGGMLRQSQELKAAELVARAGAGAEAAVHEQARRKTSNAQMAFYASKPAQP